MEEGRARGREEGRDKEKERRRRREDKKGGWKIREVTKGGGRIEAKEGRRREVVKEEN